MGSLGGAIVYSLFALGGLGVYLALPSQRRSAGIAGLIFGVAAIVGFLILAAGYVFPEESPAVYFCIFAGAALFGAAKVITHPKPVYSAVYFVLVVVAVACLMVTLAAEFVGIALIIVYAGAILVTYVFVIMLAQQSGASPVDQRPREPLTAVLVGFVLTGAVAGQTAHLPVVKEPSAIQSSVNAPLAPETPADTLEEGNTAQVGFMVMSRYVVALEIAGVLLLVALIGAIALARKRVPRDVPAIAQRPLGEIGKEVPPF